MEYRKRANRALAQQQVPSLPSYTPTSGADKFLRRHARRNAKSSILKAPLSNLPFTMFVVTLLFATYSFSSHYFLLSASPPDEQASTSLERVLHHIIPDNIVLSMKQTPNYFLPQRPRTMGFFFESSKTESFVGTERMDPNTVRVTKSRTLHVPAKALEKQELLLDSKEYGHTKADPLEKDDCVAQYEWQKGSFPTCNHLMEQDLTNLKLDANEKDEVRLIANGYWRDVWRARNQIDKSVIKTIRYEHDYTERNYDRHRRDAVAMERLTSSDYVMDIYGYCGNSGIFEFADGGSIDDSLFYSEESTAWEPSERLVVAYQVARGIADAHNFAKEGVPAMAHTDITTSQFVYVSSTGLYKLNDFNRCRFLRWNKKKNETCTFHVGSNPGTFRSPEEYAYEPETEKVDIFSMGNIFYAILSRDWPFMDLDNDKKARKLIKKGVRPTLPEDVQNSTDPFDKSLMEAMNMCWVQDPVNRATARQVERFIDAELNRLGIGKE